MRSILANLTILLVASIPFHAQAAEGDLSSTSAEVVITDTAAGVARVTNVSGGPVLVSAAGTGGVQIRPAVQSVAKGGVAVVYVAPSSEEPIGADARIDIYADPQQSALDAPDAAEAKPALSLPVRDARSGD